MSRSPKKSTSQSEIIKLSLIFARDKDEIQQRFDTGSLTNYQQLADEKNVALSTVRTLCKQFGIISARSNPKKKKDRCSYSAILTVLQRLCQELKVNYDEIKPYINDEHDTKTN
jgi:DNA-binding Xre family transcriptional regulator